MGTTIIGDIMTQDEPKKCTKDWHIWGKDINKPCQCGKIKSFNESMFEMTNQDKQQEFYNAWWFLITHSYFMTDGLSFFPNDCLNIDVAKVNPKTRRVDDDETKNTHVEIWLEVGSPKCHDIDLDCGADTFEEAIIKLAKLVKKKYGGK